jgi:hypothetical protein
MTWLFDWLLRLTERRKASVDTHHDADEDDEEDEEDEEWERSLG